MSSVLAAETYVSSHKRVPSSAKPPVAPPERLISQSGVIVAVLLMDGFFIAASGAVSYGAWHFGSGYELLFRLLALAGVVFASLVFLGLRWAYTIRALSSASRQAALLALSLLSALAGLVLVSALLNLYSAALRGWALDWFLLAWCLCFSTRFAVAAAIDRWAKEGRLARRAVIVGGGDGVFELISRLDGSGCTSIQILGLFDDRDKMRSPEQVGPYQKLGRFEDLVEFCRAQRVDLLIVALPLTAERRILHILKQLWVLPIDVRIAALGGALRLRTRVYNYIGDVPFLPVFDKPMSDWNAALKSIVDRMLAFVALVLLAPVMAAIALAVRLESRGPILFKQVRYGFNNEKIEVYKFRSMYVDTCDAVAARLVTRDDPRVTRVGRFIRRTSLDELPQLFNVAFKGDLALVGPRPHAFAAKAGVRLYNEVVDGYFARHRVKPGITGWAQINGWRGETDTEEKIEQRVAHDLFYIENWSMLFDLRILAMTPLALIWGKNAY